MSDETQQSLPIPDKSQSTKTAVSRRTIFLWLLGIVSAEALASGTTWQKFISILPEQIVQKWAFPTGNIVQSSPTVVNGVLYIGSFDYNIYAIDASTGLQKWAFPTSNVVQSSPTVVNGVLYIGSSDSRVYAIDASTGLQK